MLFTPEQKASRKAYMAKWRSVNGAREVAYRKQYWAENRAKLLPKKAVKRDETRAAINAYAREYYQRKRIERLAYAKAYRNANKAIIRVKMQAWADANRDVARAANKAWVAAHPDEARYHNQLRRARKKGNGGRLSKGITKTLMLLQHGKCAYCSADLNLGKHLDHKLPISRGGLHVDENVHLTCPLCNMRKHNKTHEEFMETQQKRSA